jgi:hypothetical protein
LAGWPVGLFVAFNLGTALSELDPAFGWRSAALNGVGAVGGLGAAILMRLAPLGGATSRRRAVARDDLQSRLAEEIAREEARRRKSVAPPAPMATLRIGARSQGMAALIDAIERGDAVEAERRLADSRQGEDLAHLDAESHWRLARLLLDADREAAAIVVGKAFLRRHGGSAEAARAQFEIGRLLARRPENRETAVDYLTSALNRSPALEASDRLQAELLVEWLESGSREATEASATEMFRLAPIDEPPRASKKSRALDLESAALAHETSELLADGPHYDLDASGPADESLFDPIEPAILPRCAEAGPPVEAPTDPPISFDLADSTPGERQAGETASVESSRGPEDTTARRSPESESNPRTDDLGAHEEKTNGVASVRLSEASSGGVEANAPARVEELWVPPANRPPLGWAETDRELLYDSRHRYAVILPLEQPADIDALVGVMAPWLRLSRLGALHAIKRSQGVLADDLELHAAQRLAGLLAGAGQGAMLVERDERLDFGEPIDALGMKFNPLGARIASAEGAHRRDWVELIGLHAGSVLVDPRARRSSICITRGRVCRRGSGRGRSAPDSSSPTGSEAVRRTCESWPRRYRRGRRTRFDRGRSAGGSRGARPRRRRNSRASSSATTRCSGD